MDDSVHVGTESNEPLRFDAVIEHPPRDVPNPGSTTTTKTTTKTLNTAQHRARDAMRPTPSYAVERNASLATQPKRNEKSVRRKILIEL